MNSLSYSKTKKGISILNQIKSSSLSLKSNERSNNEEKSLDKNEVNLETANENVKLLLTGFLDSLEQSDAEEYKNTLINFKKKIKTASITLEDGFGWDKHFLTNNNNNNTNKRFVKRRSKRKQSLYTQMPQKYNLKNKILENLKIDTNIDNISNNSFINHSNNDFSSEKLIDKKNSFSMNNNSIYNNKNNNLSIKFNKGLSHTPKRTNIKFSNPEIKTLKIVFENEKEDKKTAKSTRTKKSDFDEIKKIPSNKSKKESKGSILKHKKSSLFNFFKRPELYNPNLNDDDEYEFDKNNKLKKVTFKKTQTYSSPTNCSIKKGKKFDTKISSKTQKTYGSIFSSNDINDINSSNNISSDKESETGIDIANLRGLTKQGIQEVNDIKIKLKDKMIGKKNTLSKDKTIETEQTKDIISKNIKNKKNKEKYRVLIKKTYVYDSLDDEEYDDEEGNSFIIHPDSKIILFLDTIITFSVIYDILYIPYYLAHDKYFCGFNIFNYHIIIDFFISIVYIIDLFINFIIAYYDFEEFLINELDLIALNYISSYFFFDLLSAIPFKFYFVYHKYYCKNLTSNHYNTNLQVYPFILISLRILKVFKTYSKNKFVKEALNYLTHYRHFSQWGGIYLDIFVFFMCLHFVASLFIFIGRNQYPNWIYINQLENLSFIHIYITSIYFLIATVTTVGYGDITPSNQGERWFGLILLIVGIIVYSFAVAGISNYIKEIDDKNADYNKKLKILEDIRMNYPKLSDELYDRVSRFLKYKHFNEKKDKNIIIDSLPLGLRNSLVYEMYKPIINNFIFFKNFDNTDFIVRVILAFKPILSMKNDILVKDGDFIEEIIFVKKGRLSLEIPIDLNSRNIGSNLLTLQTNTTHLIDKKDSMLSNLSLSPRRRFNNNNHNIDKFTLNPFQVNSTKTFHLNDVTNTLPPKKMRTLEKKLKEKEEEEEREREKNIQYVKILEIRKNEHFGDILMFLNKRSPLCAKVKSKKAEFYFLNKTDAIEISTCYPRIWNKINKKSLFNMEQIKRLINKVVKIFFSAHGLKEREYINPDKRFSTIVSANENENNNNSSELHSVPSISDSNTQNNSNNSEDYNNSIISKSSLSNKTDDKKKNKLNKIDIVKEEENDDESSSKSSKYSEKVNKEIPIPNIHDINNNYKSPNIKNFDSSSNCFINDLESNQTLKVESLGKKFIDFSDNISLNESLINYEKHFFSTNSLSYNTPFRPEDINDEIYPNENGLIINLAEFKFLNLHNYDNHYKIKINDNKNSPEGHSLFKNSLILNNDNQISENSEINDKNIIFFDKDSENSNTLVQKVNLNNLHLDNIFDDSQKKNKTSTNLTYVNKEYIKTVLTDKNLRELIDNSPRNNNDNLSIISTEISFTINSEYENIDLISKHKYSKSVELRNKIKKILLENEEKDTTIITTRSNKINKNKNLLKNLPIIELNRPISSRGRNNSVDITIGKKIIQKRFKKTESINDDLREKDINIFDNNKKKLITRKSNAFGTSAIKGNEKKPNLLNVISQNIEKNQMNLNNPDEFYSEYFSNILTKNVANINNTKSSFISNTIQKNNINIQRRKSAAYMNSLLKGISVDNVRRKSTKAGN